MNTCYCRYCNGMLTQGIFCDFRCRGAYEHELEIIELLGKRSCSVHIPGDTTGCGDDVIDGRGYCISCKSRLCNTCSKYDQSDHLRWGCGRCHDLHNNSLKARAIKEALYYNYLLDTTK